MENSQKNLATPIIIAVIALLVIGLVAYAYTRPSDTDDSMVSTSTAETNNGTNQGTNTGTGSGSVNGGGTVNTSAWQTYTNAGYGFSVLYPANTQTRDVEVTGGRTISFTFPKTVPGFDFTFPLLDVKVQNEAAGADGKMVKPQCDTTRPGTLETINGIRFMKTDSSSDYAGTADSAVAQTYCAVNNGTMYNLTIRVTGGKDAALDKAVLIPQFEKVINAVQFKYLTK